MKKLILLTNYYPYYKGEEYLESEILYLSEKFDRILLFPTLISKEMTVTRRVPENVEVTPVLYDNSKKGKLVSLLTSFSLDKQANARIRKDARFNPIHYMYDSYFEARTKHAYLQIVDHLKKNHITNGQEWIVYSYWMHATAKIATDLKQVYFNDNVKYTLTRAHRYDVDVSASPINFLPEREYILENMDDVYCVSKNNQDYLQKTYPHYAGKVKVEHLGTKRVLDKANSKKEPFKIVSCSLLRKVKNVDKIVDALAELEKKGSTMVEWTHFGNGPEFETIKRLAKEKLKSTRYYFPGYVANEDVIDWYKENKPSLFINVSSSEGIPVSIMESMSCGIPCLATDVGGNSEIVRDGINGFLLPPNVTVKELANKITRMQKLSNTEFQKKSESAYQIWENEFWAHQNYSEFANMLVGK